jgi:anti-sigma factor RsiW
MNFPTSGELTCRELIEFLAAYLDGELSQGEQSIFEAHLELCEPCRDYLATYQKTIELAKASISAKGKDLPARPEEFPKELIKAIIKSQA